MPEEGSIPDNMQKGRGIVDKSPFKKVGIDDLDRETDGSQYDDKKGRGRPRTDKTWTQVGPDPAQESGSGE